MATAHAQVQPPQPPKPPASVTSQAEPGSIALGPLKLIPSLELKQGYDDNLFLRPNNVVASGYTIVSPALRLEGRSGQLRFDLTLNVDQGRYHASPADAFVDYGLVANSELTFSARAALRLHAEFRHGHDGRGTTDRAASLTPDEWDNMGVDGLFRYGAQGAQGRIEVDAGAYSRRYTNNHATTAAFERDTTQLGGAFYWRVMPKTEALVNAQMRRIDYVNSTSSLDSTERRYYVGLKWDATAATSGIAKIGRLNKTFDGAGRRDLSDTSWDVGVRWSPRTYSVFDLVTSKQTSESSGFGDSILSTNYSLAWNHAWSSRLRTQAVGSYRVDSFQGAGVLREDTNKSIGLKVVYDFRRWLRLGAEVTHSERESTAPGFDYKRNVLFFTLGTTL